MRIRIIGGGLAGCEAALQCARFGAAVELCEMRPVKTTPAHQTADFGELVCSNSLKSESENTAPWLLKQEMRRAGSPLLECADASAVPARSEEHTSELQSHVNLVCRLLLEKKKKKKYTSND